MKSLRHVLILAIAFFCTLSGSNSTALAQNWAQWRGGNMDGISSAKNLPAEWDKSKNVVWRTELPGPGGATPVIWDDHVFVTSTDGDDLVLICLDLDGKLR